MRAYLPSYLPCDTLSLVFCLRGCVREGVGHLGLPPGGTPPQPSRCQPVCGHLSSHTDPKIGAYDAPWRSACWKLSPWLQKSPSLDLLPAAKTWISCDTVIKIIKIHKTTKSLQKASKLDPFSSLGTYFWTPWGTQGLPRPSQIAPKSTGNFLGGPRSLLPCPKSLVLRVSRQPEETNRAPKGIK